MKVLGIVILLFLGVAWAAPQRSTGGVNNFGNQQRPPPDSALTISSGGVVFRVPCECPTTPEYNPVCGSDNRTYVNKQMLSCAAQCGYNVREVRMGTCTTPR